jgi:cysteinyl-tRNA synthetase
MYLHNWFYQLQNIAPRIVAKINADIKVIDYTSDGFTPFTKEQVAQMRGEPPTRIVSYLSIGEAEDYRPYWKKVLDGNPPDWLGPTNPNWPGNLKVKFWLPGWKRIVMAQLDSIIDAGFDGAYLDIIDGYEFWAKEYPNSAIEMMEFIKEIGDHARKRNPEFLIIPQNGESLISDTYGEVLDYVSGWAIEDLYYGDPDDGKPNAAERTKERYSNINQVLDDNKFVLLVEYPNPTLIREAKVRAKVWDANGLTTYITTRPLDKPTEPLQ